MLSALQRTGCFEGRPCALQLHVRPDRRSVRKVQIRCSAETIPLESVAPVTVECLPDETVGNHRSDDLHTSGLPSDISLLEVDSVLEKEWLHENGKST